MADSMQSIIFQSTHPVWGGTSILKRRRSWCDISIHPPRVGWDNQTPIWWRFQGISIHPPRVGWDPRQPSTRRRNGDFNPPTPCGVGRICLPLPPRSGYFNPPTPCGVGHVYADKNDENLRISIHPPRVGWDRSAGTKKFPFMQFQSTHPVWGGTAASGGACTPQPFQSTHPVWGGTKCRAKCAAYQLISIHPPRVGWDMESLLSLVGQQDFNPPTPCGVGPLVLSSWCLCTRFQSTHPVWGGT